MPNLDPWRPLTPDPTDPEQEALAVEVATAVRRVATVAALGLLTFLALIWLGALAGWV